MRFSKTWRYLRLQIFLSREGKIVYLYLKNKWNSNFTKLSTADTKIYLPLLRQKNAQARQTSSFGIFTSSRPILLVSGTGPPTNFEDWFLWNLLFHALVSYSEAQTENAKSMSYQGLSQCGINERSVCIRGRSAKQHGHDRQNTMSSRIVIIEMFVHNEYYT